MADIFSAVGDVLTSGSVTNTEVDGNRVTITETTTVDRDGGTILTDVNYIPLMRGLSIDFVGYNLRPTREIFYFFDDINMSHFIQRPNIIELDVDTPIRGFGDGRELVKIGSANALVMLNETSVATSNTRLYVKEFVNPTGAVESGNTVTGQTSGVIGNVVSYIHNSGVSRPGSNVGNILLALDADGATDNVYYGNVITLMTGESSNIVAYNASTRTANVSPSFSAVASNTIYSIGDSRSAYASNTAQAHYTTERGFTVGTFHLPDPSQNTTYQFFTGDRVFRIIDNASNDTGDFTTKADYRFTSNGLEVDTQQIIQRTISTDVATTTVRVDPPPAPRPPSGGGGGGCCFTSETLVTMSDGSFKEIGQISAGDRVLDPDGGYNTVKSVEIPKLGDRMLWAINKGEGFVTDEHPLMVVGKGWACFNPHSWANEHVIDGKRVTEEIEVGDVLITENGNVTVSSIQMYPNDENMLVYNLLLDGSHMYYANGYLAHNKGGGDPTAQQFFVPSANYPEGIFVTSVDLFFKNRGTILPIEVQLRPMVNGIPDSYHILPGASVVKQPNEIQISDFPDAANSQTYTRFTFPSPVYLNPGLDYCFVVMTNSYEYDFFVAEQGQPRLDSGRIITKQPYVGSMFKSQNAVTYTPIQSETVMFRLNKAVFASTGTIQFNEKKLDYYDGSGNTLYDLFQVHSDAAELPDTTIAYQYKATTNANTTLETVYNSFRPDKDVLVGERKVLFAPNIPTVSFDMQVTLSTNNTDISPFMWKNRQNLVTVENIINDMGITAENISIANTGTGYANGDLIVFTAPTGSGANASLEVDGSGVITNINMISVGSNYFDNVTASITTSGGTNGSLIVNTETGSAGGNALVRQFSKPVTLTGGFSAGDLRTFLTVSKPAQSEVNVYYRVKNPLDPETIDNKNWVRMAQQTSAFIYSKNLEKVEYEFKPSLTSNNITYTSDSTTYDVFNQYQIKIVHSSSSTAPSKIPYTHDARTIAMPKDDF